MLELLILETILVSTIMYLYLHIKTKVRLKFLYIDNIAVIVVAFLLSWLIMFFVIEDLKFIALIINPVLVVGIGFGFTMIRFWRTPKRKITASENEIVSPADGNIIHITKIEKGEILISEKKNLKATLYEVTKTNLIEAPCWLIGINMTSFDVHKNLSPIDGKIMLNKHINGKFISLKNPMVLAKNERNTLVIKNENLTIGIVQIASRLVRRIDSYVKEGDMITRGKWFGMIRFGSQVDVILPQFGKPTVELGQQVYAGESIIAIK